MIFYLFFSNDFVIFVNFLKNQKKNNVAIVFAISAL